MGARGAHRVAIDAFGLDLLSPPPFQRVVEPNHHHAGGREVVYHQLQQYMSHGETRPPRPIQHPMIILKVPLLTQSHHAQHRSHRALAGRQQRPHHQDLHVLPHPLGKPRSELYNQSRQSDRDRKHVLPLLAQEWEAAYRPVALPSKSSPMDKVEVREWWKRPILAILFDEGVDGCRIETDALGSTQPIAWFLRLKIQNQGSAMAKDVSLSVIRLRFEAPGTGITTFAEEVLDLKLSSRPVQTIFRLAPGAHQYIDL